MVRKKKKNNNGSIITKLLFGTLIIIVTILIADNFKGRDQLSKDIPGTIREQMKNIRKRSLSRSVTTNIDYQNLKIPARLYDREEQVIHHSGYTVSYNEAWRLPNWVSYELTCEKTKGKTGRAKHFKSDPKVNGICATNDDYARSGYDRGHMVPAADMKWDATAMQESFYFSNICPQLHNLNAGDWKDLEEKTRSWAMRDSAIIVISGPIVNENAKRIGVNKVAVPEAFYKVIFSPYASPPHAIGFILKHQKGNRPLHTYAVTVDSVESATGINFFPTLSGEQEKQIESVINLRQWEL